MSVPGRLAADDPLYGEAAVATYGQWIKHEALRVRSRMPWADADELVQCGVVALLEVLERFDPARGKSPWAFIKPRVHGAMLDSLRRAGTEARRAAGDGDLLVERTMGAASAAADPLDTLIGRADATALAEAVAGLSEPQQQVLQLFYGDGFNNREVAQILTVSESYASRVHREALQAVRRSLAARGYLQVKENVA